MDSRQASSADRLRGVRLCEGEQGLGWERGLREEQEEMKSEKCGAQITQHVGAVTRILHLTE